MPVQHFQNIGAQSDDGSVAWVEMVKHEVRRFVGKDEPRLLRCVGPVNECYALTGVRKKAATHGSTVGLQRCVDMPATKPFRHSGDCGAR